MTDKKDSIWTVLSAAPHRIMFLAGAFQLVATLLFWLLELTGRYSGLWLPLPLSIPATSAHIFLMIYTVFPFFTFGFLMTTYPRWMNGELVPRSSYISSFMLQTAGVAIFYAGLFTASYVVAAAIVIHLVGWASGYSALLRVYLGVSQGDKYHSGHLNIALAFGIFGEMFYLAYIAGNMEFLLQASLRIGFWLYIIPLLIIVAHKMLPFFSSRIIPGYRIVRPTWSLPLLWAGLTGHISLELAERHELLFIPDIPLALLGIYHTVMWRFTASFRERLLAVLHVAFLWFSAGMLLFSIQSLSLFIGDVYLLGKGPIHALAIGFLTSMVVAMGTRVTLGHSGRPLKMDSFSWRCFWGIQAAALLRILAEIDTLNALMPVNLNLIAAVIWLASLAPWALRYGAIYLRPRVDGQPG